MSTYSVPDHQELRKLPCRNSYTVNSGYLEAVHIVVQCSKDNTKAENLAAILLQSDTPWMILIDIQSHKGDSEAIMNIPSHFVISVPSPLYHNTL